MLDCEAACWACLHRRSPITPSLLISSSPPLDARPQVLYKHVQRVLTPKTGGQGAGDVCVCVWGVRGVLWCGSACT